MSNANFGAGPGKLPKEVIAQAAQAIIEYEGSGLSVLELPHRGKLFDAILEESKALVKELCGLDDDYHVLWLQGGRLQFSMVPMNFLGADEIAGYIDSGHWAAEAIENARCFGNTEMMASGRMDNYERLPEWDGRAYKYLQYLHCTTNNTIYGTQWHELPQSNTPLIADMSSDILSQKRNYTGCKMFYAVAQKNLGAAGVTLVVIHKDMLAIAPKRNLPPMLDYREHAKANSVLNTPPVFAIYTSLLMLRWTKQQTIAKLEEQNILKSSALYAALERNSLFEPIVTFEPHRSRMNVCFRGIDKKTEERFSHFCKKEGIMGIDGHRAVGGFRASLYNAVTMKETQQLIDAMRHFEQQTQ